MTEMAVREHNFNPHSQPETRMERRRLQQEKKKNLGKKVMSAVVGATIGCMPMAGVVYAKHAQREAQRPYEPLPPCTAAGQPSSLDLTQPEVVAQRPPVSIAEALGDHEALEQQKHEALHHLSICYVPICNISVCYASIMLWAYSVCGGFQKEKTRLTVLMCIILLMN